MLKKALFIISIIILGGFSGIIADRYLFPYLSTTKIFEKYQLLKKSKEDVTIIQKTEQVIMKEDSSLNSTISQAASAVVNISYIENFPNKNISNMPKNMTGQIITSDGIIITYDQSYKPEMTRSYKVACYDGNTYDAQVWDYDSYSNILFLKINASNLPVISFANSDQIAPGEKIIAVSNALGDYENGFEQGILSRFDPSFNLFGSNFSSSEKLEGVFRADFINDEIYEGGPLIDMAGESIGMIGALEKEGKKVYFTIPSQKIKIVIDKGIKKEFINNAYLGIYYIPITKSIAAFQSAKADSGALIYNSSGQQGLAIVANSPATKAGLRINDVIKKINSEDVNSKNSLADLLYKYKKGDQIELIVLRDGSEMKISVQL